MAAKKSKQSKKKGPSAKKRSEVLTDAELDKVGGGTLATGGSTLVSDSTTTSASPNLASPNLASPNLITRG
jgi:hypothetical protein